MPLLFSHSATFVPSLSMESACRAPPGATMIAEPVDSDASGRYTVSVGSLTFVAIRLPPLSMIDSGIDQFSEPGAFPGQSRNSSGAAPRAFRQIPSVRLSRTAVIAFIRVLSALGQYNDTP